MPAIGNWQLAIVILLAIVYFNPTKIFLLLAIICAAVASALALATLMVSGTAAAVITALGLVGALGLFGLGLVADLLRQIMRNGPARDV